MRERQKDVHIIFFLIACTLLVGGVYFVARYAKHNIVLHVAHAAASASAQLQ